MAEAAGTSAVNPNVPVGNEPTVQAKIGEPTSFEQLESVTEQQIAEARKAAKEKRAGSDKRDVGKDRKASGADVSEPEDDTEAKPDSFEADANKEASIGPQADKVAVKLIKINQDGNPTELSANAMVPVKVSGEATEVPLQELINNYSGKVVYDKKYNELATERKKFHADKGLVEERASKILELATKDPLQAFTYLAEFAGKDPVQTYKEVVSAMSQAFGKFNSLDELSREKYYLDREREFFDRRKKAEESVKQREAESQKKAEQERYFRETFNIDDDTYAQLYREIEEAGLVRDGEIRADHVAEYSRWKAVGEAVMSVDKSLFDKPGLRDELIKIAIENPKFTAKDLSDIIRDVFGSKTAKSLSKKVRSTQSPKGEVIQQKTKEAVRPQTDVWSFDQL